MLNESTVYKITERMLELNNSCTILIRILFFTSSFVYNIA